MTDEFKQTVRIVRRSKVRTDERGRTVWDDEIEEAKLELVSTAKLKRILASEDEDRKRQIRDVAATGDGVLAHDPENDRFEVIDDADLEAALASASKVSEVDESADVVYEPLSNRIDAADEELSLVSTQALRRILDPDSDAADDVDGALEADTGFDPYNSG